MRGALRHYLVFSTAVVIILVMPALILADSFIDSVAADWNLGTYSSTTTSGDKLTLDINNATGVYYPAGGYASRVFDAGEIVLLGVFNWSTETNPGNHTVGFSYSYSNESSDMGVRFVPPSNNYDVSALARYFQYYVNATTTDNQSAPNITSVEISYDITSPSVSLDSPADDYEIDNSSGVSIGCSAGSPNNITGITLYWNYSGSWEANGTDALSGPAASTSFVRGNLSDGQYIWNCMASDTAGNPGWGPSNRTLNVVTNSTPPSDTQDPVIEDYSVTPQTVSNGSQVTIHIEASDNVAVDAVWAVIDYPGAGEYTLMLTNNGDTDYTALVTGTHYVTFFANDTSGNAASETDSFASVASVSIDINVSDSEGDGVDSDVVVFEAGSSNTIDSFSSTTGNFQNKDVPNGTYDLQFSAFGDEFVVLLEGVDIWENTDRRMGMDDPGPAAAGFVLTYAAETDYGFGSAVVRVYYDEDDVDDENGIGLYVCQDWNFSNRSCSGSWNDTGEAPVVSGNFFEMDVSGFSAFSVRQDSYCGDGVCDSGENSTTCSSDCACNEGDTRPCSSNRYGICAIGSETCANGVWLGCPSPRIETCNQQDDDCDGVNDDVGGGISVESTFCGCYDGSLPTSEIFDGIDNDCNGFIDDGCVCNESQTEMCGSPVGECIPGTRTCTNCVWGECTGQIGPFDEVCGNGLDDDCDGATDEITDCIVQTDTICADGAVPPTGCRCGLGTYASGYCCGGTYSVGPCPEFPWWILIVVGGVVLAVAGVYYFLKERAKSGKDEWSALEKKYTPAKI